jgi:hypothetical protein
MQAYIEHCEDYYVGKWRTNEMRGTDHESEFYWTAHMTPIF